MLVCLVCCRQAELHRIKTSCPHTPFSISYVVSNSLWRWKINLSIAKPEQTGPYPTADAPTSAPCCSAGSLQCAFLPFSFSGGRSSKSQLWALNWGHLQLQHVWRSQSSTVLLVVGLQLTVAPRSHGSSCSSHPGCKKLRCRRAPAFSTAPTRGVAAPSCQCPHSTAASCVPSGRASDRDIGCRAQPAAPSLAVLWGLGLYPGRTPWPSCS